MGTLYVVGIGPGAEDLLTPRARAALARAEVIVGFSGYLDQVRRWLPAARLQPSAIGAERERAEAVLRLASAHERVALVGSGDAGVYGLAGLAFELRAALDWPAAGPPTIEVIPGVTAMLAAAALLGAPLGHDFAAISLSDLLTPWEVIVRRLEAVASADFVVALYNPTSAARRQRFEQAVAILARHRPPGTPVGVVSDGERPGGTVVLTTLATLPQAAVSMLSIVLVGNAATVVLDGRMVTPRGYLPNAQQSAVPSAGEKLGGWSASGK